MSRVTLVEDDPVMLDLLSTLLKIEGFEVESIQPGKDVFDVIKTKNPDVILLDVHLRDQTGREINGFDILSQIRDDEQLMACKVIMSSGIDFNEKSSQSGADGFILKPYMPDALIKLIKQAVG